MADSPEVPAPEYTDAMRTRDTQTRMTFARECQQQAKLYTRKANTAKRGEQRSMFASTARIYVEVASYLMGRLAADAPLADDSESTPFDPENPGEAMPFDPDSKAEA